jgi:DNA-binding XRE family transcriptional regulator
MKSTHSSTHSSDAVGDVAQVSVPAERIPQTALPDLARLLREHRDAANLTQEELAELAELSVRAVSDLERGVTRRTRGTRRDVWRVRFSWPVRPQRCSSRWRGASISRGCSLSPPSRVPPASCSRRRVGRLLRREHLCSVGRRRSIRRYGCSARTMFEFSPSPA